MLLSWLMQSGPKSQKHSNWPHALTVFVLHYVCVAIGTIWAHDWLVDRYKISFPSEESSQCDASTGATITPLQQHDHRQSVANFLILYFLGFLAWRLAFRWNDKPWLLYSELYRQTFICSGTIFNAAIGLYTNRPIIATAFCVAVGIDQSLWYVDLSVFAISGKFPIGLCKYLFWPGTTWVSRISSTHHFWTVPLVTWASGGMHPLALPLSAFVVLANVILSRCMTPHSIANNDETRYLNVNMSHELWPDLKVKMLLAYEDKCPYLIRLFLWWWTLNSVVFSLIYLVSGRILGPAPLC